MPRRATSAARSESAGTQRPLSQLRDDAAGRRRCPLWRRATQTVFGAGDADAAVVVVGEQPGDKEDVAGEPFVGPAGQLLRKALAEELELAALRPRLIVAMGATAVRSLLGPGGRVVRDRGTIDPRADGPPVLVTVHPSSILRVPDAAARRDAYAALVADLRAAAGATRRRAPRATAAAT